VTSRNPFPADPVATYGVPTIKTCDKLTSVLRAERELIDYLSAYAKEVSRYGGVVALAGAHGSGKTHLLLHLDKTGRTFSSLRVGSVYVKPDAASLFSAYRKALEGIGRAGVIHLLDGARRALAKHYSDQTRITESISARIDEEADLSVLVEDGTVDADALENALDEALHSTGIPGDVIQALKLCETSSGEKAFQWLLGNDVSDPEVLGLSRPLRQTETSTSAISAEDSVAIDGLSLLSLLHRVAESPFVVLIDQFDILLPREVEGKMLFPAITTFMESLKSQQALVFIAGSEAAWKRLPPDVWPRLRSRAPLPVGALSREEIAMLVDSLLDKSGQLSDEPLSTLDELTGGNPREVLAISHELFEKTDGHLNRATVEDVAESGRRSGTVEERARLALTLTDEVIADYGRVSRDVALPDGRNAERVVRQKGRVVVAILLVRASDSIDETAQARNLRDAIQSIRGTMTGAPVVAVTVGYTSAEVRALFKAAATVIPFDDRNYKAQLEAEMVRIDSATEQPKQQDPQATAVLEKIAVRLDALENERRDQADKAQERFEKKAAKSALPDVKEREQKTLGQLLEELDVVEELATADDTRRERESIRSILINNEAYRNDRPLDELGGLYLDVINIGKGAIGDARGSIRATKSGLLAQMRARLLQQHDFFGDFVARVLTSVMIGLLATVIFAFIPSAVWQLRERQDPPAAMLVGKLKSTLLIAPSAGLAAGILCYGFLYWRNPSRVWRRTVTKLRESLLPSHPRGITTR
jgi:hypothetical protein